MRQDTCIKAWPAFPLPGEECHQPFVIMELVVVVVEMSVTGEEQAAALFSLLCRIPLLGEAGSGLSAFRLPSGKQAEGFGAGEDGLGW